MSLPGHPIQRRSLLAAIVGTSLVAAGHSALGDGAVTEDDLGFNSSAGRGEGNLELQAIGALGVGHIQSTLGLIGVIADSLSRDVYSQKQIEDLMGGTVNGLEAPKRLLRRLQDTKLSADDVEFIDRMIGVFNALQKEAKALVSYARSRKNDDAAQFERSRRQALHKLSELTHQEDLIQSEVNKMPATAAPKSGSIERLPQR